MFTDDELDRYARHLVLREVGGAGQQRLKAATVAIVGLGGIGAPAALYLAAAGIGRLILIDFDTVDASNLQRQVIYRSSDVGRSKLDATKDALNALNPHVEIVLRPVRLNNGNTAETLAGADLIVDGTDDFAVRLSVNAAAVAANVPLVSAALGRWEAQVAVFEGRPCYQCFVPEIPPDAETCQAMGIVGAMAGVGGTLAALAAIRQITGAGDAQAGKLLLFDGLSMTSRSLKIGADPKCPVCGGEH